MQAALLDSLFGTKRGANASSEVRAEISELITKLEAKNPTPSPAEAEAAISGTWRLVYTSNSELFALLFADNLPLLTVGDITQTIDAADMTVENRVELSGPVARGSLGAKAKLEVRSESRLQVVFSEGTISTPELVEDITFPSSIDVMGQSVDLSPAMPILSPLQDAAREALKTIGSNLNQLSDLSIPITSDRAQSWLLTTYLDDDTRISRGDGGSIFVLVKDNFY